MYYCHSHWIFQPLLILLLLYIFGDLILFVFTHLTILHTHQHESHHHSQTYPQISHTSRTAVMVNWTPDVIAKVSFIVLQENQPMLITNFTVVYQTYYDSKSSYRLEDAGPDHGWRWESTTTPFTSTSLYSQALHPLSHALHPFPKLYNHGDHTQYS